MKSGLVSCFSICYPVFSRLIRFPPIEREIEFLRKNWEQLDEATAKLDALKHEAEVLLHQRAYIALMDIQRQLSRIRFTSTQYATILMQVEGVAFDDLPYELAPAMWDAYHALYSGNWDDKFDEMVIQLEAVLDRYFPTE